MADILKIGSTGQRVIQWQKLLSSARYYTGALDGIFGEQTKKATLKFQAANKLEVDGNLTEEEYNHVLEKFQSKSHYPDRPNFGYSTPQKTVELFGSFAYRVRKDKTLEILDNWDDSNIVAVSLPMLVGVLGFPENGLIQFNKQVSSQLEAAFWEIEQRGLTNRIISWAGSFYPRLIRGGSQPSNHSWGTSFDINAPENWLNSEPARPGQRGCLYEIVPIFLKYGFFWGGHFKSRLDGMHFEAVKILTSQEINNFKAQVVAELEMAKRGESERQAEKERLERLEVEEKEREENKRKQKEIDALKKEAEKEADEKKKKIKSSGSSPDVLPDTTEDGVEKATSEILQPEKYNEKGFYKTMRDEIASLLGGNVTLEAVSNYTEKAQLLGLSSEFWNRLVMIVLIASVIWVGFRFVHYIVDSWKQNERLKNILGNLKI